MSSPPTGPLSDRRATVRRAVHCPCLVRFDRRHLDGVAGCVAAPAEIQDLSAGGVGLLLRPHLPPGAGVALEPLDRDRLELPLAQVVRYVPCSGRWRHGCALGRRLTGAELQDWLD
jgi:hypothetical protein